MVLNIGILYASLYNQVKKKYGENNTISRKEFNCVVGKHFLVPNNLKDGVIKEMEDRKLILRESRDTIKILPFELDLDKYQNKFYTMLKIF